MFVFKTMEGIILTALSTICLDLGITSQNSKEIKLEPYLFKKRKMEKDDLIKGAISDTYNS